MANIFYFIIIGGLVFIATFAVRLFASNLGIVDKPDKRKVHKKPMPLLGGAAIYTGLLLVAVFNFSVIRMHFPLFLGASLILLLGLIDDVKKLPASLRFIVQLIASLILIIGGIRISFFPACILGDLAEIAITLVWLVGVTNAFNYLDGLDGLACGSAIINTFYLALLLYFTKQSNLGFISLALLAACLGFLPHNFKKARIFLGDAGSMFLGFMLAGISVAGNWASDSILKLAIPILILGVPIFDMTFTTIMRIRDGKVKSIKEWLEYGGKDHFHHYLVYLGFSPTAAVFFIWAITLSLGISGTILLRTGPWKAVLVLIQSTIVFAIIGILIVVGRRRKSGWSQQE